MKELFTDQSSFLEVRMREPVLICGELITVRDASLKRFFEESPDPDFFRGKTLYFCGPTPTPPGKIIGSCGPTTTSRMEPYFQQLADAGVKALIGKGGVSDSAREILESSGIAYFSAVGGTGAFLAKRILSAETLFYPELGPEAIYSLKVELFPAVRF